MTPEQMAEWRADAAPYCGITTRDKGRIVALVDEVTRLTDDANKLRLAAGELTKALANANAEVARLRDGIEALADEWERTVYKLPPGYPMTLNSFCRHWFKAPLRALVDGERCPHCKDTGRCGERGIDCKRWDER